MSKKEDRIWAAGFDRACRIAEEKGLEGLMEERRFRATAGIKCRLTASEIEVAGDEIKRLAFQTMKIAFLGMVHDAFGIGPKRIKRLLEEFNKMTDYLEHGWIYWEDLVNEIQERLGVDVGIEDGEHKFDNYVRIRPESADMYDEADLIDRDAWAERIKSLGLVDDGKTVLTENGRVGWDYEGNPYYKIWLYDFLGGIEFAIKRLGARPIGETDVSGREKHAEIEPETDENHAHGGNVDKGAKIAPRVSKRKKRRRGR